MADGDENHVKAARVVDAVLRDLNGRSGFDGWFESCDRDIRIEIRSDLIDATRAVLDS